MTDLEKWTQFLRDSRTRYERREEMLADLPGYSKGSEQAFPVLKILDSKLILPRAVLEALVGQGVIKEQTDLGNHTLVFDPTSHKYVVAILLHRDARS